MFQKAFTWQMGKNVTAYHTGGLCTLYACRLLCKIPEKEMKWAVLRYLLAIMRVQACLCTKSWPLIKTPVIERTPATHTVAAGQKNFLLMVRDAVQHGPVRDAAQHGPVPSTIRKIIDWNKPSAGRIRAAGGMCYCWPGPRPTMRPVWKINQERTSVWQEREEKNELCNPCTLKDDRKYFYTAFVTLFPIFFIEAGSLRAHFPASGSFFRLVLHTLRQA